MTVVWPANETVTIPPHAHIAMEDSLTIGILLNKTVGSIGIQEGTSGIHGAGVGTPSAAAVSAITSGFAGAIHIPNVGMTAMGAASSIFAAGVVLTTRGAGSALMGAGEIPNEQDNKPPVHT